MDITRVTEVNKEVTDVIEDIFTYHEWNADQIRKGDLVKQCLMAAVEAIITSVPPSPDRSAAIRKIREARMDCNSAITHNGKY